METKKTTISEYIARKIQEKEKKEETNEEKIAKAWEEFYLK